MRRPLRSAHRASGYRTWDDALAAAAGRLASRPRGGGDGGSGSHRSLDALTHVEMGFRPDRLLTGQLFPADGHWPSDTTVWPRITAQALTALEAVPGVSGATLMIAPPFTAHLGWDATYMIEGEPTTALRTNPLIAMYTVRPGSFRTLGISWR